MFLKRPNQSEGGSKVQGTRRQVQDYT